MLSKYRVLPQGDELSPVSILVASDLGDKASYRSLVLPHGTKTTQVALNSLKEPKGGSRGRDSDRPPCGLGSLEWNKLQQCCADHSNSRCLFYFIFFGCYIFLRILWVAHPN